MYRKYVLDCRERAEDPEPNEEYGRQGREQDTRDLRHGLRQHPAQVEPGTGQ